MELVKVNESVNRTFNGEVATEEVTSVTYDVVENGANIGSASISDGYFSVSAQMPVFLPQRSNRRWKRCSLHSDMKNPVLLITSKAGDN